MFHSLLIIWRPQAADFKFCRSVNTHACPIVRRLVLTILYGQPRRMGAPKGAPVSPPSTTSSTALMYDESSEARKSTALARSSGSPQRPSGTVEEKKSETFADSSAVALARPPR